jgi:hypothetical protein
MILKLSKKSIDKLFVIGWISLLDLTPPLIALNEQTKLPLNQLMIPTSFIKDYWDKQEVWGELTAKFIEEAVNKLKSNEITTINDLYNFLAQARLEISQILNHGNDVSPNLTYSDEFESDKFGQPRIVTYFTMVENRTRYSDFFSELIFFINANHPQLGVQKNCILYHNSKNIKRSKIIKISSNFIDIIHTEPESFNAIIALAENLFIKLKANKASQPEKTRKTINKIYFYIVDAMLSCRGSSAISEMLYHALERHFLDNYSYISTSNSAEYTGQRAISPDILAMVSPSFTVFNKYFTKHIYGTNKHIKITQ